MSLYNDLTSMTFTNVNGEELSGIQSRAEQAVNDLLLGITDIGSIMFWAAANEDYDPEDAKSDMYKIGAMLQPLTETVRALSDHADEAKYRSSKSGKGSKA